MGSRTKKELLRQKRYDMQEFVYYNNRIKMLTMNLFEWEGLEDWNIPVEFVENELYEKGQVAFYFSSEYGLIACRCLGLNKNIYNLPTKYQLIYGNTSKIVNATEVVILYNNYLKIPTSELVNGFIRKLCDISRTIDTNIYLQKLSKLILVDDKQRLTLENLMLQYEGNVPFIVADKFFKNVMEVGNDKIMDLSVDFKALELLDAKSRIWRELLETVGINSANTEKRERLTTNEVDSNNELNKTSNNIFFNSRKIFCDKINKKWKNKGVNINIERSDFFECYDNIERVD